MLDATQGKIIPINIEQEMKNSYIDYAMSVIVGRALPDVRDGLKPVHRRILFGMNEMGVHPDKPYKKSARIVGDVMGKYHPHGDSAIYDTMVRMAQNFSMRYVLVDGHGNFGSVDGDPAAAQRYTEARLSKFGAELLVDIDKETVDFLPNYDGSEKEPAVLPARLPNLLVSGSAGIAVGMATNIPPHNLSEVIDGAIYLIDNEEASIDDLHRIIKGPDFPTAGLILGREGIRSAYHTGRGIVKMRAVAKIETTDNGRSRILVSELPFQVNKAKLLEKIAELVRDKKIEGISDLRDESDRAGMRVVIELRKDANPRVILNHLYKQTQMQETFGVNMIALVNGQPKLLNLHEVLYHYIQHQKVVVTRRTQYELRKAEARAHILEGLKIALDNLDEVIKTIRASKSGDVAKSSLMDKFGLSEKQTQAILDMRLQRLTALEREKIMDEYREILKTIARLQDILANERKIFDIIKNELIELKNKYGDERRTQIVTDEDEIDIEDLIAEEDIVITITHQGYTKRLPVNTYKTQRRGGRGVTAMNTKEDDFLEHIFVTSTHKYIMFFTNKGKVYKLKGYEIPEASRQARGVAIVNLLNIEPNEKITAVIPVKEFDDEHSLLMLTKKGITKKTVLSEFSNSRKNGLIALTLDLDDDLVGVKLTDGKKEIIVVTKNGQALRFAEQDVRNMGRTAHGVRGIKLGKGDIVVGMGLVSDDSELLVVTTKGFGKRTPLAEYKTISRGSKGVKTLKVMDKNGEIADARVVDENDELMVITSQGIVIRFPVKEVSVQGRDTQGVKVMRLDDGDSIVALARFVSKDDEEEEQP